MHTKPHRNSEDASQREEPFLQQRRETFLGLFLVMFLVSLCISGYTVGVLEIAPTRLILQPQGCALLKRYGVPTEPFNSAGMCEATAMFRATPFSDKVYVDDEPIRLEHDQIVGTMPVDGHSPWTVTQKKWGTIWLAVVILTAAMAILNQIGSRRRK